MQHTVTSLLALVTVAVAAPFTVASECSSLCFLMEIVFVRSQIHSEAGRGGVESGLLKFISGPQSVFCLASWSQPRPVNYRAAPECPLQLPAPLSHQPASLQLVNSLYLYKTPALPGICWYQ